jgi:ubiquinone/menaquinone biosynthesis C-methylase UbiE
MVIMLNNTLRRLFKSTEKILGQYIRNGDRVLDIGFGPGYFARSIAKMVGDDGCVIAADLEDELQDIVR